MSVNTSIYGTQNQWFNRVTGQSHTDPDKNFLTVCFGGGSDVLQAGYGYGIQINKPIDKSLSWCGLGNFSTWSRINYFRRDVSFSGLPADNRQVTNFSWNYSNGNYTGLYYANDTARDNSSNVNRSRFSPQAINLEELPNYNNKIQPFAQIPVQNCVLVPRLTVCKQINESTSTSGMDIRTVNAWDYYGTTAIGNHTTHPYILGIGFVPYTYINDNAATRSVPSINWRSWSILDKLAMYEGQPNDIGQPDQNIIEDGYSYYAFHTESTNPYIMIFGKTDNGNLSASYCKYFDITKLSAATDSQILLTTILFPHNDASWSAEFTDGTTAHGKYYYLEYYDGLQEWVRRQIACFGLFFTDVSTVAQSGDLDDDNMFLGILENGIGNGNYSHGDANRNQPQWNWKTTNDSDYTPSGSPSDDPNSYGGKMRTHDLAVLSTATKRYALSPTASVGLLNKLWDFMALADPDVALTDYSVGEFLVTNPIDSIVSLQYIPVTGISDGVSTSVRLGTHDTEISCYGAKTSIRFDCGDYFIFPRFGDNWIDRQTKITLYLPFCGTVNLDPEIYMGHYVNVEYLIDLTTGSCSAVVSMVGTSGERVITDIANGNCAMDLPVTGIQQQTLNSQLFNASEQTKQLKVNNAFKGFNSIMSAVTKSQGGTTDAISGILGGVQDIYNIFQSEKIADYNLQHTMIPTKMIGTTGGITGSMCEWYPTIIFERPYVNNLSDWSNFANYAHSVGYACCISGSLSGFSGYTEVTNVDLSGFTATATEKNMIQSALSGGVYL